MPRNIPAASVLVKNIISGSFEYSKPTPTTASATGRPASSRTVPDTANLIGGTTVVGDSGVTGALVPFRHDASAMALNARASPTRTPRITLL